MTPWQAQWLIPLGVRTLLDLNLCHGVLRLASTFLAILSRANVASNGRCRRGNVIRRRMVLFGIKGRRTDSQLFITSKHKGI